MYGWFGTPIDEMLKEAYLIITIGLDGWDIIRPFKSQVPIISIDATDTNDRTFQPVMQELKGEMSGILDFLEDNIAQRDTSKGFI